MSRHGLILLRENVASENLQPLPLCANKKSAGTICTPQPLAGTTSRHYQRVPRCILTHRGSLLETSGRISKCAGAGRTTPAAALFGLPTAVGVPGLRSSTPKHPSNFCKIIRLCLVGGSTRLRVCDSTRVGEHPPREAVCHTQHRCPGATRGFFTS